MTDASGRQPTTPVPPLPAGPVARPARIWPRSLPARIGRARTSTVVLVVLFVGVFALWVGVRPENTAGQTSRPASVVQPVTTTEAPATTTAPAPTTTGQSSTPRSTSSRPTTTAPSSTEEEEPTTSSSSTSDRPTSASSTTRPAPASSTPATTSADPTD